MTKFRLPKGARHVRMEDGTVYRSTGSYRNGRVVEVDNPRHAAKIAEMNAHEGFLATAVGEHTRTAGRECQDCAFQGWKYQKVCPRCGGHTKEVTL